MSAYQKIVCAAALYIAWLTLVILHFTPADGFVNALLSALTALGIIHAQNRGDNP